MTGNRRWIVSLSLLALVAAATAILFRPAPRPAVVRAVPKGKAPALEVAKIPPTEQAVAAFHLFESNELGSVEVQYALPQAELETIRLGAEAEVQPVSDVLAAFASDWTVIAGRIPRSAFEGVYHLPMVAAALADSSELFSLVGRLLDAGSRTEGFAIFRPDATFDVYRIMPILAPASSGFSLGLKYRWVF